MIIIHFIQLMNSFASLPQGLERANLRGTNALLNAAEPGLRAERCVLCRAQVQLLVAMAVLKK